MMVSSEFSGIGNFSEQQLAKRRKFISFFDAFSIFAIHTFYNNEFCFGCACEWVCVHEMTERLRRAVIQCECAECANDLCVTTVRVHRNHKSFERLIICLFVFACHPIQVNIAFRESWQDEKFILTNKFRGFLFYSQCSFLLFRLRFFAVGYLDPMCKCVLHCMLCMRCVFV